MSERIALQMGTFSKALGGAGAYVAGSKTLIDILINQARGFIYSTAMPPAVVGAAYSAVQIVQSDSSMKNRLWENLRFFEECVRRLELMHCIALPLQSPIIPVVIGDDAKAVQVSAELLDAGYLVQAIRPPTVPSGTARLRISISAAHTQTQLEGLLEALAKTLTGMSLSS
jgi:7-keto-8-aminopelargonate synthetase-like enzyme